MEPNYAQLNLETKERLTPKEMVKKHISDPNHKITEEEFDKLVVGVFNNELVVQLHNEQ